MQLLIHTGLTVLPGREGNDAVDGDGREYEFKTLNAQKTTSFSTHHHLNLGILAKYRGVAWVFGVYEAIELQEIWHLEPETIEDPYFRRWEVGFKVDSSFLRFVTMGAIGVRAAVPILRSAGFRPIELERYCSSNKIWTTKVKRLRVPDLLCVKTAGLPRSTALHHGLSCWPTGAQGPCLALDALRSGLELLDFSFSRSGVASLGLREPRPRGC